MSISGKLIGALLGWLLLRSPAGLLIGLALGHLWDSRIVHLPHAVQRVSHAFIAPLFGLAGAIAKSDGRVSTPEIAATENLMARLQLTPDQRAAAIAQFNAGKQADFDASLAITAITTWCRGRRDLAWLLLDMLLDIVYAEGPLAADKFAIVRKLCAALGVDERELAALAAMKGYAYAAAGGRYRQSRQAPSAAPAAPDAYAVLGLDRGADESAIKRAYRKLMSQYHPDKLGDVPEELKRRAGERAREINAAYEKIRDERGIR